MRHVIEIIQRFWCKQFHQHAVLTVGGKHQCFTCGRSVE